ncbi:MAG: MBL fold metallo-hydrolase [Gammaproteobacteria bacterium]|nr:MBL fold metallo-hydrolase [Gammaproteobacteria bacterium]MCY3687838.1 MBL fold metallo-hydrolase [Gammaproteobacteria bacterium]MDE0480569.1 MBL fold metallo-hydrolase [Gammaproteobacteria bacterium]
MINSHKLSTAVLLTGLTVFSGQAAQAQVGFADAELSIEHVAGNVYMVQRPGGGGNIGAFIGPDGVLLVDSLFAPMTENLVEVLGEVTDSEIRFLINTHIHGDHVGGNANLAEMGVVIFAHDNTRVKFLEESSHFPRGGGSFAPRQPVAARPVVTYNDAISFHLNGEEVHAFLAPPAHTDGDTFVYFPESDVLHLGDVFRTTSYPIVDKFNGGTLRGTIAALDLAIDMAGPDTRVIPGHGLEVVGRAEMVEFRDMILDIRDRVYAMIRQGLHLDEIMAAQPAAAYDAKWGQEASWTAIDFVPLVYYELGGAGRLEDRQ